MPADLRAPLERLAQELADECYDDILTRVARAVLTRDGMTPEVAADAKRRLAAELARPAETPAPLLTMTEAEFETARSLDFSNRVECGEHLAAVLRELHAQRHHGETPAPETPRPQGDSDHWCVEVGSHGENLVTIEPRLLTGKPEFTPHESALIRTAGEHLLAFIGYNAEDKPRLGTACINCDSGEDGGYCTSEGEVGPFCASCWEALKDELSGQPSVGIVMPGSVEYRRPAPETPPADLTRRVCGERMTMRGTPAVFCDLIHDHLSSHEGPAGNDRWWFDESGCGILHTHHPTTNAPLAPNPERFTR